MDLRQGRTLMALYAVDVFLDAHRAELPMTTSSGARARFSRGLAELALHIRMQEAAPLVAQQLTRAKEARRIALIRDFMAPIARIAKLEAARLPELQSLKMPRGQPGVEKLLAHAAGMLGIVSEHIEVFIELGLPPTVVDDMRAAIDAVIATITDRSAQVGQRRGATKGVGHILVALNKQKSILDSFIRSELRDAPSLLASWQLVKRVEKLPGRRRRAAAYAAPQSSPVGQLVAPFAPIADPRRLLAVAPAAGI
jgi:hypothetical protein